MSPITQQLIARYGNPATSKEAQAAFEKKWLVLYVLPAWLAPHFPPYKGQKVVKQWMNRDAVAPFEAVMHELCTTTGEDGKLLITQLISYGGGGCIRLQRDSTEPSVHSWYLAFDFNEEQMPFRCKTNHFSHAFMEVWRRHGWRCGADFGPGRSDPMHFEYTHAAEVA